MSVPTSGEIAAVLKKVSLFAGLERSQIEKLMQRSVLKKTATGQLVFTEGDECHGFYVVLSGAVKIFKQSAQGREQVLTIERAGGVVAELPVFDGSPYPASCQAIEPSALLFLDKEDFRSACRQDPELALKVLASVGTRLRRLVIMIEELSFLTVRKRLANLLLELTRTGNDASLAAGEPGQKRKKQQATKGSTDSPLRVSLNLTHQEIATRIGTVRELVSRNLSRLQAEGVVRLEGHSLIIQDLKRLEQEALDE